MTTVLCQLGDRFAQMVKDAVPSVEVEVIGSGDSLPADAHGDVLLTSFFFAGDLPTLFADSGVRWVHNMGTGVDKFPLELVGDDQVLTCSRGAGAEPISEWVITQMLAFEKRLPESWIHEPPEHWNLADLGSLNGSHLGLIGLGGIASAVARRALPFGTEVRAFRRTATPADDPAVEVVTDLVELAGWCDHLVVAAPSTPATRHLVGPAVLEVMGPGAHLVNIARGALVDQDALRVALDDGRIALASLDTVDPEPLPAGHWLYEHPKVHLSAHISWSSPGAYDHILVPFLEDLARWEAGEPLQNVVDLDEKY